MIHIGHDMTSVIRMAGRHGHETFCLPPLWDGLLRTDRLDMLLPRPVFQLKSGSSGAFV